MKSNKNYYTPICLKFILMVAIFIFTLAMFANTNGKMSAPVKIAIIPYSKNKINNLNQIVALLEVHLGENDNYTVLDREHINKLLNEQVLLSLSEASSVSKRIEYGKILGADILVLLSERQTPQPYCDIVICETSLGIRLLVSKIAISGDYEKDFQAIINEIEIAMQKKREQLKAICAVTPFINHDLSINHKYLQGAYTKIIESILLKTPGIVLVEIPEAHAIADELSLTGKHIKRSLPFYFVGEFRYDKKNSKKTPFIKITLEKGNQIISFREGKGLSLEAAPEFLRKSINELLEVALDEKIPNENLTAEYKSLSKKARFYFSIGQYKEAAQLADASLLLEPKQEKINLLAMSAYGKLAGSVKNNIIEALQYYDQALVHLEHFLRQWEAKKSYVAAFNSISEAFGGALYLIDDDSDEESNEAMHAYRKREREMYIRVIKVRSNEGTLTGSFLNMTLGRFLFRPEIYGETLKENLQKRLSLVPMFLGQIKYSQECIKDLTIYNLSDSSKKTKEYAWFLNELSKFDDPNVKFVVNSERQLVKQLKGEKSGRDFSSIYENVKKNISQKQKKTQIDFNPIIFQCTETNDSKFHFELLGLIQCGEKIDLVWGEDSSGSKVVCLMKEKGKLQQIYKGNKIQQFGQPAFDGKYVWLPVIRDNPLVLVVNPITGSVKKFTSEDGLPPFYQAASASIGEGKLCLSGVFGKQNYGRAFVAILELTKKSKKRLKIIHEATKQLLPDIDPSIQIKNPHISYYPKFMIAKQVEKDNSWRVLLCRSLPGCRGRDSSLLINPNTEKVEIIQPGVESHISYNNIAIHHNKAYWSIRDGLRCIQVNSKDNKILRTLPEEGLVVFYKGRFHLFGRHWWVADDIDKKFKELTGNIPKARNTRHFADFFISAHFGLVFKTAHSQKVYQVIFYD